MTSAGACGNTGTLVLVVGPSGAGKDTLIAIARELIGKHDRISFPRRIVTRESSPAEDHDTMTPEEFDGAIRRDAFAFWWDAHGHRYGLAAAINDDIRRGISVVCNVSRAIVPQVRRAYTSCKVILVDAPHDVRAQRIRARKRGTDGDEGLRLNRSAGEHLSADVVIVNVGDPRDGGQVLARAILAEVKSTNELSAVQ
jgi:ribose 1,5-bisphosphokinase